MNDRLLKQAMQGDADAFTALCGPYEGLVYRHCLQMLRNRTDAEDAAQEALLRAYRSMPRFRADCGVATWLYRIAHNVCLDVLKRPQSKTDIASLETLRESGYEPPDDAQTPESAYLAQSDAERLADAVAELPDEQRTLISLRYGDGLSYDELALATGLTLGTVKSRLNRAKERLRALMEKTCAPPDPKRELSAKPLVQSNERRSTP